ncbi:N-acetyltransferase [Kribbella sandramycini]|uniref:N-acetyltransferase n=1 Tax=Kribbella sandramycini TaxID=60450 RepID=A0A7Y4P0E8_9ACTN|nr:N-acetyltransferase [Kribbella sandramycini]MBB6569175.1 putative N-acetyltransferase YhbS [Kribbella sandramycini]NOL40984.1 N-acetyltransferase [Kribbella sandramycini]
MSNSWKTRVGTAADEQIAREITLHAFGRQYEVDYWDGIRADPVASLPGQLYVATHDEQPVGYALLTRCFVGAVPVLSLGPVAVLPEYQGRGAGDAAVRAALAGGQAQGERAVVVLGHAEYYPRFGFRPATEFGVRHPKYDGPSLMALALSAEPVPAGPLSYPYDG